MNRPLDDEIPLKFYEKYHQALLSVPSVRILKGAYTAPARVRCLPFLFLF